MAFEIERKFLLANDSWKSYVVSSSHLVQAYISHRHEGVVRLRIVDDAVARLTIKGKTDGIQRHEWEYDIPVQDAHNMIAQGVIEGDYIEKTRHTVEYDGFMWEIDIFHGRHEGLMLAEIELPSADAPIALPPFIGREVSHDPRYFNSALNRSSVP